MVKNVDLIITRGDSKEYILNFTDSDGDAIDITGYTVFFTVKYQDDAVNDDDALITKTVTTHNDPTGGQSTVTLTNTDTDIEPKIYYYDFQIKDTSDKIYTALYGKYNVLPDITRRTS